MAERPKFQFRMRDLLWGVTLIAVSLGTGMACTKATAAGEGLLAMALFAISGASLGAGIGVVFRRPACGAIVFAAVCLVLIALAIAAMSALRT